MTWNDMAEDYAAVLKETKEQRLQEILEETKRILGDLGGSSADLEVEQPKALARGELMPHQMKGLRWMASLVDNEMSGILADDMGLGKTVQTLALLAFLAERRQQTGLVQLNSIFYKLYDISYIIYDM